MPNPFDSLVDRFNDIFYFLENNQKSHKQGDNQSGNAEGENRNHVQEP